MQLDVGATCYIFSVFLKEKMLLLHWNGDNNVQSFHLGRYIVGYTVGNLVLQRRVSGVTNHGFRTNIRRSTTRNDNFEYSYPLILTRNVVLFKHVLCLR